MGSCESGGAGDRYLKNHPQSEGPHSAIMAEFIRQTQVDQSKAPKGIGDQMGGAAQAPGLPHCEVVDDKGGTAPRGADKPTNPQGTPPPSGDAKPKTNQDWDPISAIERALGWSIFDSPPPHSDKIGRGDAPPPPGGTGPQSQPGDHGGKPARPGGETPPRGTEGAPNPGGDGTPPSTDSKPKASPDWDPISAIERALGWSIFDSPPSASHRGDQPTPRNGEKPAPRNGEKPAPPNGEKPAPRPGDPDFLNHMRTSPTRGSEHLHGFSIDTKGLNADKNEYFDGFSVNMEKLRH